MGHAPENQTADLHRKHEASMWGNLMSGQRFLRYRTEVLPSEVIHMINMIDLRTEDMHYGSVRLVEFAQFSIPEGKGVRYKFRIKYGNYQNVSTPEGDSARKLVISRTVYGAVISGAKYPTIIEFTPRPPYAFPSKSTLTWLVLTVTLAILSVPLELIVGSIILGLLLLLSHIYFNFHPIDPNQREGMEQLVKQLMAVKLDERMPETSAPFQAG